jgi:membrane-associated phospholipid phosphatase
LRPCHSIERLGLSLLMIAVFGFAFVQIDARNAALAASLKPLPLETALDPYIPFVPAFIFAYLLYYPWLLLPVPILQRSQTFYRAMLAFALVQVTAIVVYLAFPSRMVRPDIGGLPAGLGTDLIAWLYRTDRGWNLFPSLHVAHSSLVAMLYWVHCRKAFWFAALGALLIAASTVLIKQHYVIDIPAGVLLAFICLRVSGLAWPAPMAQPSAASWSLASSARSPVSERDNTIARSPQ